MSFSTMKNVKDVFTAAPARPGIEKNCVPEKLTPEANCVGVPVAVALFAFPDLSFQTVTVEPDRVMLADVWSAPSSQS
jgi:hypothetical protein